MVKMRMMLVDDEERFLQTTRKLLAKHGHDVITASSGEECLQKLTSELVHVVILDVKMPGMDGVATLKQIKQRHPLVEVIMLTGHATAESAVEGLKSGATDYLVKPADIETLTLKAQEAFNRRMELENKIQLAEALKKSTI
ncbi:response regulator [Desulfatitalea alkaliphila]|uniref:Response regulator n=1 Tax=Desulfatitalea alkaliphila TaxID=2929485 RepID=A0AA41UJ40_9BACT|nr:response regulator [Desulfatitalea alkaliphila]MCJ8500172.1 response regulator [Desulfatitalea alkaliphila]